MMSPMPRSRHTSSKNGRSMGPLASSRPSASRSRRRSSRSSFRRWAARRFSWTSRRRSCSAFRCRCSAFCVMAAPSLPRCIVSWPNALRIVPWHGRMQASRLAQPPVTRGEHAPPAFHSLQPHISRWWCRGAMLEKALAVGGFEVDHLDDIGQGLQQCRRCPRG